MGGIFNNCISYDTQTDKWTTIEKVEGGSNQSFPSRFAHCLCVISSDKIVLAGGVTATHDLCDSIVIRRKCKN